jgi:death-on-curing protein
VSEWKWIGKATILAIHDEQLAEHGGMSGVRDVGMLESAMARPINKDAYGASDVFDLAAAYAFGIIRNHPFIDGNKRTGYVAAELFLMKNGQLLTATDQAAVMTTLQLAESTTSEDAFAAWLRENSIPFDDIDR